jgi:uncharacterized protein YbaR (Trm112 family)
LSEAHNEAGTMNDWVNSINSVKNRLDDLNSLGWSVKHDVKKLIEVEANPDADEFECEKCYKIFDIEDSIKEAGILICPKCYGEIYE